MKKALTFLLIASLAVVGCTAITKISTTIGVATGRLTPEQARSINKVAGSVAKWLDNMEPSEEYYLGRAVTATLLQNYKPYDSRAANTYINTIGQTLATASDKPDTFGGYRFLIINTDQVNAFAMPGGFILISRGILRCANNEDELAAVLAHEIAHIELAHGVKSISKGRFTSVFATAGAETLKQVGNEFVGELTEALEGSVSDIVKNLAVKGYSKKSEYAADESAVKIMKRVGYDPTALRTMLVQMKAKTPKDSAGFGKTHPSPDDRIDELKRDLRKFTPVAQPANRLARFKKAMVGI